MPTISFSKEDLLRLSGASEKDLDILPLIGVQVESIDGDEMTVEIEANRADMFSVEGIARYLKGHMGIEEGFVEYEVQDGDFKITVDESVRNVRPYIGAAHITGIEMDDYLIRTLMDLQEKLHATIGRKRKKLAIGVHDSSKIGRDIVYRAVRPEEVSFVPLAKEEEMNLREILERHEKGRAYRHLLEGKEKWPILMDSKRNVLSFPPIINGQLTALNENTKEIFIDMTGTDLNLIKKTMAIFCSALADRGGRIESAVLKYPDFELRMPDMSGESMDAKVDYINSLIGTELSGEDMVNLIKKSRFGAVLNGDVLNLRIPSYRMDILHPVDIAEEIAIAYGYDRLIPELPKEVTFGSRKKGHVLEKAIMDIMIGLGFNEINTLTLSNEDMQFRMMRLEKEGAVTIKNPITEFHTMVRTWLLPSIMDILSKNRHRDLPQRVFELGEVVYGDGKNRTHVAGAIIEDRASFTAIKSIIEAIFRDLGVEFEISEKEHGSFIKGRCASIMRDGKEIGFFGEVHPEVLQNFELEHPVSAFEFSIEEI
jgi:phenylalanyl-tRNA synthetase beta chain